MTRVTLLALILQHVPFIVVAELAACESLSLRASKDAGERADGAGAVPSRHQVPMLLRLLTCCYTAEHAGYVASGALRFTTRTGEFSVRKDQRSPRKASRGGQESARGDEAESRVSTDLHFALHVASASDVRQEGTTAIAVLGRRVGFPLRATIPTNPPPRSLPLRPTHPRAPSPQRARATSAVTSSSSRTTPPKPLRPPLPSLQRSPIHPQ